MIIDGISYELVPKSAGMTTEAYTVTAEGEPVLPGTVVVLHHGASADCRWCVLGPGLPRVEACNQRELFEAIAKAVHG